MILLPNNCYCSPLKVFPKSWNSEKASCKKDWYIYYRFYDPLFKLHPQFRKGKLVVVKGMNHFTDLNCRRKETEKLLSEEMDKLTLRKYNPITCQIMDICTSLFIEPWTPFNDALPRANDFIKGAITTKRDLSLVISQSLKAAMSLGINNLPIKDISKKHIKAILSRIEATLGLESSHRYNKIRAYLMMLFNELVEQEAVETNPVKDIKKKPSVTKVKALLSDTDRKKINSYLKEHHYRFWLFVHIFFHSGARITELLMVRKCDVNVDRGFFVVTIKKGKQYQQFQKPIKLVALPYWLESLQGAQEADYLFSRFLKPGPVPIQAEEITRRWGRHVKKKLGITEDFYSLKHLNLDETSAAIGLEYASVMASHQSSTTTLKHYTVNEVFRQNEKLRRVDNRFA